MFRTLTITTLFIASQTLSSLGSANGQDILQKFKNFRRDVSQKIGVEHARPTVHASDTAMETLASEIDWLENHLDEYGSVVVKQPDIWGESRLTKYRQQVEKVLQDKLGGFQPRDNARIQRSDVAQLAAMISINSASDVDVANYENAVTNKQLQREAYLKAYDSYLTQLAAYNSAPVDPTKKAPTAPTPPSLEVEESPFAELNTSNGFPAELAFNGSVNGDFSAAENLEPVIELNQLKRYLDHLNQLRRVNEGDDTSDAPGYALNLVRIPVSIMPGRATRRGYGAEVTVTAKPITSRNLLPSTFRNLVVNDLVNELSLPIVKMAEANPSHVARFVYANTEISERMENAIRAIGRFPDEHQDLKKVLRDIVDAATCPTYPTNNFKTRLGIVLQYGDGLRQAFLEDKDKDNAQMVIAISEQFKANFSFEITSQTIDQSYAFLEPYFPPTMPENMIANARNMRQQQWISRQKEDRERFSEYDGLPEKFKSTFADLAKLDLSTFPTTMNAPMQFGFERQSPFERFSGAIEEAKNNSLELAPPTLLPQNVQSQKLQQGGFSQEGLSVQTYQILDKLEFSLEQAKQVEEQQNVQLVVDFGKDLQKIAGAVAASLPSNSANRSRRSRFPLSPAITHQVYGNVQLLSLAADLKEKYNGRHVAWNESKTYDGVIHILDAKRILQAYFDTAYDTLSEPAVRELLVQTIEGQTSQRTLSELIALGDIEEIARVRASFLNGTQHLNINRNMANCCWIMVVEMAMLNKRLNEDAFEHAMAKGNCECKSGCYHMYYLPMPKCTLDALDAVDPDFAAAADEFCKYVACRWPIHVFTIDPVHQEQNVSDASLLRRELSIAAALAFTQGNINLNQLTRFQRQFQEDIATVGLNRTQAGFMHDHDVFGWRFSPRVQTHRSQGNIRAFGETLFGRGPDANWKEAMLEPGMRECTAIVLMPSFVPYCDFDVRTNWFQINKPTHTDMSMKETMKLSRAVTQMRAAAADCQQCAHLYRPGDMDRMLNRVEQLEREIPLQVVRTQIPYENNLGGFDLFNNGLTDLGPRLEGWYGAPGVVIGFNETDEDKKKRRAKRETSTSLFLVAHNLSVNQTQVIAGGIAVENPLLISRDVMQIKIPDSAQMVQIGGKNFVAVYVATPYGTTNHLHIPVITEGLETESAKTLADLKTELLKKIAETPYAWSAKPDVDLEITFGGADCNCVAGPPRIVMPHDMFELESKTLKTIHFDNDNKDFAIVGVLTTEDGKNIGKPMPLVHGRTFVDRKLRIAAHELISSNLLATVQSEVTSALFKGENVLKLKLKTYIMFRDMVTVPGQPQTYSNPIPIGGDLSIQVVPNNACRQILVLPPAASPVSSPVPVTSSSTPSAGTSAAPVAKPISNLNIPPKLILK